MSERNVPLATGRSYCPPAPKPQPAMAKAADKLIDRWRGQGDGATIDVAAEMTRVTLDVLERSIFSDGLGRQAEDIRMAMATYFNTIGKISPLDLAGGAQLHPSARTASRAHDAALFRSRHR